MLPYRRNFPMAVTAVAATLVIEFAADLLMLANPRWMLIEEAGMAVAVGAGVFFFERWRGRYMTERLRVVRDMNLYVRNELQVLIAATQTVTNPKSVAQIERAVDHIEWALRELLPGKTLLQERMPPFELRKLDRPA